MLAWIIAIVLTLPLIWGTIASTRPRWKVVAEPYTHPVLGAIAGDISYWYTAWIANDIYNTLSSECPPGTVTITEVKYAWFGLGKEL